MNKKITLICALFLMCFAAVKAETRIYFAYGNNAKDPLPVEEELTTVDYRCGNGFKINNWDNLNGPWNPSAGSFVEGGALGYRQYGFDNTKSKFQVIHMLEGTTGEEKIADLSMVTEDWTFHLAIKTDHEGVLLFQILEKGNAFTMDITDLVDDRTGKWNEIEIEMADFVEESATPDATINLANLTYSSFNEAGGMKDMWIIRGEGLSGTNIGWDDCYLTDNGTLGESGKAEIAANKVKLIRTANAVEVAGNEAGSVSLYNLSGVLVAKVQGNTVDLSNVPAGVYVVKAGKDVFKFVK